jgi:hypothetical protein
MDKVIKTATAYEKQLDEAEKKKQELMLIKNSPTKTQYIMGNTNGGPDSSRVN